jgi:hypothetical protein
MQAILKLLEKHIPKFPEGADPTTTYVQTKSYMIHVAGPRVEIPAPAIPPDYKVREAFPEREALIALVLKAREERVRDTRGRSLWHDAIPDIYADGTFFLKASWEFEPSFKEGGSMTRAGLKADLKRWSIRCIRIFSNGIKHAFCGSSHKWRDQMPEAPSPPLTEIDAGPQFAVRRISKQEFEKI